MPLLAGASQSKSSRCKMWMQRIFNVKLNGQPDSRWFIQKLDKSETFLRPLRAKTCRFLRLIQESMNSPVVYVIYFLLNVTAKKSCQPII